MSVFKSRTIVPQSVYSQFFQPRIVSDIDTKLVPLIEAHQTRQNHTIHFIWLSDTIELNYKNIIADSL